MWGSSRARRSRRRSRSGLMWGGRVWNVLDLVWNEPPKMFHRHRRVKKSRSEVKSWPREPYKWLYECLWNVWSSKSRKSPQWRPQRPQIFSLLSEDERNFHRKRRLKAIDRSWKQLAITLIVDDFLQCKRLWFCAKTKELMKSNHLMSAGSIYSQNNQLAILA